MSRRVLLDTNIISYWLKQDSRIGLYEKYLDRAQLCLSFVSIAELYRWSLIRQWGRDRIDSMESTLEAFVHIPHDIQTSWVWAEITTVKGRPRSPMDAWIAATAVFTISLWSHIIGITLKASRDSS